MGVLGIGGLFFRARDPEALGAWYRDHLGVGAGCAAEGTAGEGGEPSPWFWTIQGGPVVFQPFRADSDYFPADKQYMLNLRVSGIDGLLTSLRAAGIATETRAEWDAPETGRFARIADPEGNPIELWEPPAA
ncbi:glyoxalase [Sphingomonas sp. Root710]|uniref:VOC family protein n=1 Tax=Sphingomonas sp. Root710 TaxID=1736594 RepID=UPI0006F2D134|nr:VOC family protein [Sphingomonas sp. Root710]KRB80832.1 glyoxalase [Sphingomonas sp. Root710]